MHKPGSADRAGRGEDVPGPLKAEGPASALLLLLRQPQISQVGLHSGLELCPQPLLQLLLRPLLLLGGSLVLLRQLEEGLPLLL